MPKIAIFRDYCGCRPTFFKAKMVKFGMTMRTWDSLPQAKFCKNRIRGYTLLGKFIPKIPILAILGAVGPHFVSQNGEIWYDDADLGLPSLR